MKLLGQGNTATVYEWDEDKVVKLYREGYPEKSIAKEYNNAKLMELGGFQFPRAYDLVNVEGKRGIIFQRIQGSVFLEELFNREQFEANVKKMARLHKGILKNVRREAESYKSFLLSYAKRENDKMLEMNIEALPGGEFLCHGDFHPANIMVSNDELYVIDFMNVCKGPKLYDIARTVYLTEYTPLPDELDHKDSITAMRTSIVEEYLKELEVKRCDLIPFLKVIHHTRQYECPHEFKHGFEQLF